MILNSREMRARFRIPDVERRYGGAGAGHGRGEPLRVEHRQASGPRLVGHAAVFNALSEDLGGFREKIAPGAFRGSLTGDVRFLFNHDANWILGRTRNGTLALREDSVGLFFRLDPLESALAEHVLAAIERGDVSQMSFAFRTITDRWKQMAGGQIERTLLEVELFDTSAVVFPAYPQTDVGVDDDTRARRRRMEELLATLSRERRLHVAELELGISRDLARTRAPWHRQAALERELGRGR